MPLYPDGPEGDEKFGLFHTEPPAKQFEMAEKNIIVWARGFMDIEYVLALVHTEKVRFYIPMSWHTHGDLLYAPEGWDDGN